MCAGIDKHVEIHRKIIETVLWQCFAAVKRVQVDWFTLNTGQTSVTQAEWSTAEGSIKQILLWSSTTESDCRKSAKSPYFSHGSAYVVYSGFNFHEFCSRCIKNTSKIAVELFTTQEQECDPIFTATGCD
jgi:hypothetical protein